MNFGHSFGHAIESHCLTTDYPLLHGEAVALGMLGALWISVKQLGLDASILQSFENQLLMLLSEAEISLSGSDIEPILSYLVHDKKNKGEKSQFVLLEAVGKPVWDVEVEPERVKNALEYVINKVSNK